MTYTTTTNVTTTTTIVVDALTGVKTTTTTVTTTVVETPIVEVPVAEEAPIVEVPATVRKVTGTFNGCSAEVVICRDWDGKEVVKVSDVLKYRISIKGIDTLRNDNTSYHVSNFNAISRFIENRKFYTFDKIKGDYVELV
ncbi:MAG: hypothetical protein ACRCX2_01865 [Paraclostridium sp.]